MYLTPERLHLSVQCTSCRLWCDPLHLNMDLECEVCASTSDQRILLAQAKEVPELAELANDLDRAINEVIYAYRPNRRGPKILLDKFYHT
jgi:hypothetical protein